MEKTFHANPREVTQTKITFWFYVISIPVIAFLLALPYILGRAFQFSILTLAYVAIFAFLVYGAFRAWQVMRAVQASECTVTDTRVEGVSTPDPHRVGEGFSIERSEIKGVGRKQVNITMSKVIDAIAINTDTKQYVLLAMENEKELLELLQK